MPGGANCDGWCSGLCTGTCAGTCEQGGDTCEGLCWTESGACIGELNGLVCDGTLTPEPCLGDCGTLCSVRASLDQTCQAPSAEVFGDAPPLLLTALIFNRA